MDFNYACSPKTLWQIIWTLFERKFGYSMTIVTSYDFKVLVRLVNEFFRRCHQKTFCSILWQCQCDAHHSEGVHMLQTWQSQCQKCPRRVQRDFRFWHYIQKFPYHPMILLKHLCLFIASIVIVKILWTHSFNWIMPQDNMYHNYKTRQCGRLIM